MNIKDISKLTQTVEAIKSLDKDIISLEKLGIEFSQGKYKVSLKLSLQDMDKKEIYKEPDSPYGMGILSQLYGNRTPQEPENVHTEELDDYLSMNIIAFLLKDKQKQRETLLQEIDVFS